MMYSLGVLLVFISALVPRSLADDATVSSEEDSTLPLAAVGSENDAYKGSPAINALVAFSKPSYGLYSGRREINLPVGKVSSIVASLAYTNPANSQQHFTLDFIEGALHYPMYYDYHIQNFTKQRLHKTLNPVRRPAVELAGRSFDLSVVVYYHDNNNIYYAHKLFNQTINLYEIEEGVDTQLIFLVVLVIALSIAVLIGAWHWFTSKANRRQPTKQTSKLVENNADSGVVENEYLALINDKSQAKKGRSDQTVRRRQGRR
uniref:Translocon-associated protein subunit alpha n=1 Tax=Trichobilharzia regenti TaxID=157069 RepID=A0AA85JHW5_TRIRE|nr:unnamed protein product [Trichobilharzia regenti]